ncbi:uncharacterized protein LOC128992733 [Macrosteles quadrilineatus]|uniref:uncharacterized protein LOC128992733 n=1 Tax=Macrosteles quadrilineatus TaxID=74068 RepID=UPI0023E3214D|nr:uncharacterized protein LOC128992733 [Macrosteles quadrilineatus]
MAPTVCMAEVGERLGYLDTTSNLNYRLCEKRRSLQKQEGGNRKRLLRHIKTCHQLQMGLVLEECCCQSPSLECDLSDTDQSPRPNSLVTLTLRTLALLRRNHLLQQRLSLLQQETRAFVSTVLSSPDYVPPVTAKN